MSADSLALTSMLESDDPVAACEAFREAFASLRSEIGRVLVGQEDVVDGHRGATHTVAWRRAWWCARVARAAGGNRLFSNSRTPNVRD